MNDGYWLGGFLAQDQEFGSHYDQADGTTVTYEGGTPVRFCEGPGGLLWVKAPNGRVTLVGREIVSLGPGSEADERG